LTTLAATLERSGRRLEVSSEALERLVDEGYSLAYGARFLKRLIEERVKLPISQQWHEGPVYNVVLDESLVVVTSRNDLVNAVATTGVAAY
jgi:ATP-dependent Clp protease ATP-binding subunit ClpA